MFQVETKNSLTFFFPSTLESVFGWNKETFCLALLNTFQLIYRKEKENKIKVRKTAWTWNIELDNQLNVAWKIWWKGEKRLRKFSFSSFSISIQLYLPVNAPYSCWHLKLILIKSNCWMELKICEDVNRKSKLMVNGKVEKKLSPKNQSEFSFNISNV